MLSHPWLTRRMVGKTTRLTFACTDSLELAEYIMSVEATFQVHISDEDAEKLTTVGETQAYLQDKGVL